MNKRFLLSLAVLTGFAFSLPVPAFAAKKADAGEKATPEAGKAIPFHGKVTAVDATAKTFSLKGKEKDRVFTVTDQTTILGKDGAAATLDAIPVGEEVRGSAVKNGDTWTANKVTVGAKDATAAAGGKGKPSKTGAPVTPATPNAPSTPAIPAAPEATPAAPAAPAPADGAK